MDPGRFDEAARRVSQMLSRRSLIGGSLGAAVLAALGLGEDGLAKKRRARERDAGQRQRGSDRNRGQARQQRRHDNHRDANQPDHERNRRQHTAHRGQDAGSEGCLRNGKRCGKKKLPPCKKCCSGYARISRRKKRTCACRPDGFACAKPAQCCARICDQGVCGALS